MEDKTNTGKMLVENMGPLHKKEWQHCMMMDIDDKYMTLVGDNFAAVEVVLMKNDDRMMIDKIAAIVMTIAFVVAVDLKTLPSMMLMVLDRM